MDQITHDVRRATWHNVIKQCQERHEHTTVKQWCLAVSAKKRITTGCASSVNQHL